MRIQVQVREFSGEMAGLMLEAYFSQMFSTDNSCPRNGVEEVSILFTPWSLSTTELPQSGPHHHLYVRARNSTCRLFTPRRHLIFGQIYRGPHVPPFITRLGSGSILTQNQRELCQAKMCHVLDYEQQHAELLETSPNYWARKLPEGLAACRIRLPTTLPGTWPNSRGGPKPLIYVRPGMILQGP